MIKVGIDDATGSTAGELLRILVNHPDVEITQPKARGFAGRPLSSLHHGLIGESDACYIDTLDPSKLDVLFIMTKGYDVTTLPGDLKVIDLSSHTSPASDFALGHSESNRKTLVRGATRAFIPSSTVSVALTSLHPLALNLLLPPAVDIKVECPSSAVPLPMSRYSDDVHTALSATQASFQGEVDLNRIESPASDKLSSRGVKMESTLACSLGLDDLLDLYEKVYDDHNFTFLGRKRWGLEEVIGTNKCILTIEKPDTSTLRIIAIADARLKGGAGEAVHVMNLLCGLHEKTGLALKASAW